MKTTIRFTNTFLFVLAVTIAAVHAQGPAGYIRCASEGESYTLTVKSHVAFGANGSFNYLYNQTGTISFNNGAFGDPAPGFVKAGYYKVADNSLSTAPLSAAINKIKDHLTGTTIMTASAINARTQIIRDNIFLIGANDTIIKQGFDVVDYYESTTGPLFINTATKGGFPNVPGALDGHELTRAVFLIQQGLFDEAFTHENLAKYPSLLDGKKFGSAAFFPGACAAPANPSVAYVVKINGSMPSAWGRPTAWSTIGSRKPTGYYLAPGSIATVTVPASMADKGFKVLVGAHSWDKTGASPVRRFIRVVRNYPIIATTTRIANPFGGGIYIVTPYEANLGIVEVQLANVVAAPLFSAQSFNRTTLQEWNNTQRNNPAPWADFVSDKFMMQVPRGWIYNYANPVSLLQHWDKRMDGVSEFLGYPLVRNNYILYLQVDLDIMYGVYGIGYPQVNNTFDPASPTNGNVNHWFLHANADFWETELHELGHSQVRSEFPGETEAIVNVLSVIVWNKKYGMDIDSALGMSMGNSPTLTRDQAALNWMVAPNFRLGKPMDISNTTRDEVRYQQRGYAKYIEIAALFGWDVLGTLNMQENLDYMSKKTSDGLDAIDSRILRLSMAGGVDLRPLIHFWGTQPVDSTGLKNKITAAGLKSSPLIYDRLMHYQSIIPLTGAAFQAHAAVFLDKSAASITAGESPDYGEGWYYTWLTRYNKPQGDSAKAALQHIIDLYFPNGRPMTETNPPMPNPATFASAPTAVNSTSITMTATSGSDVNGPVQYLFTKTGGTGGVPSSVWQNSPVFLDTGLTPGVAYTYTVTLRDAFANRGSPSAPAGAMTSGSAGMPEGPIAINAKAVITSSAIKISGRGPHTVMMYSLAGRLIRFERGVGPATYALNNTLARGVYLVRLMTPAQNIRQRLMVF